MLSIPNQDGKLTILVSKKANLVAMVAEIVMIVQINENLKSLFHLSIGNYKKVFSGCLHALAFPVTTELCSILLVLSIEVQNWGDRR